MLTKIGVKQTIRTTPALAQILLGTVMHVAVNMVGARQWCGVVLIVINGGIGLASRGGVPRLRLFSRMIDCYTLPYFIKSITLRVHALSSSNLYNYFQH